MSSYTNKVSPDSLQSCAKSRKCCLSQETINKSSTGTFSNLNLFCLAKVKMTSQKVKLLVFDSLVFLVAVVSLCTCNAGR